MNNEMNTNGATTTAVTTTKMSAIQLCGNMSAITGLGQMLSQSGFFGAVPPSTATAAVVNSFLEGLSLLQYKAKYHTFNDGQTGIKSDFIQREFHRLGGEWEFVKWDATECDMRFTYRGKALPFRVTFDEFVKNGVALGKDKKLKTNWEKFPREMLKARCMATAIRALCPEAMEGMYTQEEVQDFDRAPVASAAPMPVAESVAPIADTDTPDCEICPCGSVKGKPWTEIALDKLKAILATPEAKAKSLTPEHRNAIVAEIARREMAAKYDEVIEAEVVETK